MRSLYAEVKVEGSEPLEFRFDSDIIYEFLTGKDSTEASTDNISSILSDAITEWNLTDDDGNPIEISIRTFQELIPFTVISDIIKAMNEACEQYKRDYIRL